jgi:hypothetical protein
MRPGYRIAAITATVALALVACQPTEATPATVAPTTTTPPTPTTTTIKPPATTTTTTTTIPEIDAPCPEWHPTAIAAGWDIDQLHRLGYIIWRESRCDPNAFNGDDPNSGSRGLTQINGFWCLPSKSHPDGWLQDQEVLAHCDELYDPMINLIAAYNVWRYAEDRGCGWSPWTTRNTKWC